ncbi:DUF1454 family protein [Salmonella enterica subsp. enterica]|nr:DUF1454 family protein [Salmonella enterica subsp. enterica]
MGRNRKRRKRKRWNIYGRHYSHCRLLPTKERKARKLQRCLSPVKVNTITPRRAVRYVVADNGEKGLTFAVEPIAGVICANLEGAN